MQNDYTTYIDESGDLGVGAGTKWFVLTAIIVKKSDEAAIRTKIRNIRFRLNMNEIHFRKIHDFYKKAYIVSELADLPFTFANIIIDTEKIINTKLPTYALKYNYSCKILLERVSWFMRDNNGLSDIVLSSRGTSRDGELISYIKNDIFPYSENNIEWQYFQHVCSKQSSEWDLLQLADACATSMFMAYEKHPVWGFTTPCFARRLVSHLYKHDGKIESYGIKYLYSNMKPDIQGIRALRPCGTSEQKERDPGATSTVFPLV